MSIERAQALIELQRYEEAIKVLQERLAIHPYDSQALVILGYAQFFNGDWRATLETAELGISVDHSSPGLHGLRAQALAKAKRFDEAYESFETALRLDPNSVGLRTEYVQALVTNPRATAKGGDKQLLIRAQEFADQLVEAHPDDWITHYSDARVKAVRGKLSAAETAARRALKLSPNNADAHNLMGVIQQTKGDLRQAGDSYVAAGRADPRAANTGGLESLGKVVAPVGLAGIVILRLARAGGRGADLAGADIAVVLVVIAVIIAIGFAIKSASAKPQSTRDYSHLSKDAQDIINRNR